MLEAVEGSGVKHAYGATSRYSPALVQAKALLDEGLIGELREAEAVAHFEMSPLMAHSWIHSLEQGGGMLMNLLPHFLGQVQYVSGGTPQWATGLADSAIDRAPVGSPLHDFRDWSPVDVEAANGIDWRAVDADMRATAIVGLETPNGVVVRGVWHVSPFTSCRNPGYLALAGDHGTMHLTGLPWHHKLEHKRVGGGEWSDVQISPSEATADPVQHGWNRLTAEFLMDVQGTGDPAYPTFRDGYIANQVIDRVRNVNPQPLGP
jgi:predicted dehydrogenase